ncbi:hypothetical protein C8R44DRAFT_747528 [Mycena epipterygia]|nr:hypothetical protein C8R44DRAFT_747528 [Mycena epipterygia]
MIRWHRGCAESEINASSEYEIRIVRAAEYESELELELEETINANANATGARLNKGKGTYKDQYNGREGLFLRMKYNIHRGRKMQRVQEQDAELEEANKDQGFEETKQGLEEEEAKQGLEEVAVENDEKHMHALQNSKNNTSTGTCSKITIPVTAFPETRNKKQELQKNIVTPLRLLTRVTSPVRSLSSESDADPDVSAVQRSGAVSGPGVQ